MARLTIELDAEVTYAPSATIKVGNLGCELYVTVEA